MENKLAEHDGFNFVLLCSLQLNIIFCTKKEHLQQSAIYRVALEFFYFIQIIKKNQIQTHSNLSSHLVFAQVQSQKTPSSIRTENMIVINHCTSPCLISDWVLEFIGSTSSRLVRLEHKGQESDVERAWVIVCCAHRVSFSTIYWENFCSTDWLADWWGAPRDGDAKMVEPVRVIEPCHQQWLL